MAQELAVPNPRDVVRNFRKNYVNLHTLWMKGKKVPKGVTLVDPKRSPIKEASLPDAIRSLLDEYRKAHPDSNIVVVKYMRMVNGGPEKVVEDETPLPPDDQFLSLTQTVTLSTSEEIRVITEIVLLRRS
jgi:hypothetical protein